MSEKQRNLRQKGSFYEQQAALYLESIGFTILDRNVYTKKGEIDLVCRETVSFYGKKISYLVFVEVKYRSSQSHGWAVEAVNARKRNHIMKSAQIYLKYHDMSFEQPIRFDVLAIDEEQITLYRNAWGGM